MSALEDILANRSAVRAQVLEKLAGRKVAASVSGGKDSAAMSLLLMELEIEHERVFLDTGWEHELTYEYLRGELTQKLGPIIELRGELGMEALILKKGMFPSRVRRFCTQELKVKPMQKYINARVDAGEELVNAVGIRRQESQARAKMAEWEWSEGFDCEVWRPIVAWSLQDVIDIHHRHGLKPNPLYLLGAGRVGCWPCIFSRKSELRFVAEKDPDRINRIRELEAELTQRSADKHGLTVAELIANRDAGQSDKKLIAPTFFGAPDIAAFEGKKRQGFPIDEAVRWSMTSRGGKQVELFAGTDADTGCMRWGLCETAPSDQDGEA